MSARPSGHDAPRPVLAAVVVGAVVVAVCLLLLRVDLAHQTVPAPAPHVVVWTPSTYGPPPTR